uniref:G_PROTEIN_RECEP_F1_2 domain-containing protein n=1 Tax=Rhabditophanes sp. KR3021 TaxID=114890 RepID=A0AC35U8I5_9BILA
MNCYVVFKMSRLRRRDPDRFSNGIGICLWIMAISDVSSLLSIFFFLSPTLWMPFFHNTFKNIFCKGIMFIMGTAYSQSMWVWLLMSGLRYTATYRPLKYTTLWRIPVIVNTFTFICVSIINIWVLVAYEADEGKCICMYPAMNIYYESVYVFISYGIPTLGIFYMDIAVIFCRSMAIKTSDPLLKIVINRPEKERKKSVYTILLIIVTCLTLNTPENLFRLITAASPNFGNDSWLFGSSKAVAKLLFFMQFLFNAFYLTTLVYDKSVTTKTNSSRQLSISVRVRIEESAHLIRERSSTISYRASSPTLHVNMVRNASFCVVDSRRTDKKANISSF